MNKKAVSLMWAANIQLIVAAFVILVVYQATAQTVDGTSFEQDLYATESALLLETMSATDAGILDMHLFSTITYEFKIDGDQVVVTLPGDTARKQEQIHIPSSFSLEGESSIGRGIRWVRAGTSLGLSTLQSQTECAIAPIEWETLAIIARPSEQDFIRRASDAYEFENVTAYYQLSQRKEEDLFIRLARSPTNQTFILTGAGEPNRRLLCLFANDLQEQGVQVITRPSIAPGDQLQIFITEDVDLVDIRDALSMTLGRVGEQ